MTETRELEWEVVPGDLAENRVVGPAWVGHGDGTFTDVDDSFPTDEVSIELGGVALFEAAEFASQHGVEGVGDHGEGEIEVDLDENGGGEGVEVEELDGLGDAVLDAPTSGVVTDQEFHGSLEIVGDQEGGLLVPDGHCREG